MGAEVQKASLPYFKPWTVVDTETGRVLIHCDSEQEAIDAMQKLSTGRLLVSTDPAQPVRDPFKAADVRMNRAYGGRVREVRKPVSDQKRIVEL